MLIPRDSKYSGMPFSPQASPQGQSNEQQHPSQRDAKGDVINECAIQQGRLQAPQELFTGQEHDSCKSPYITRNFSQHNTGDKPIKQLKIKDHKTASVILEGDEEVPVSSLVGFQKVPKALFGDYIQQNHLLAKRLSDDSYQVTACPIGFGGGWGEREIHRVARSGDSNALLRIIKDKVSRKYNNNIDITNSDGDSALNIACRFGHLPCAKMLVENKGDVNFMNHKTNDTPLHIAVVQQKTDILNYLGSCAEIKMDPKNNLGQTPLLIACQNARNEQDLNLKLVEVLLTNGANPKPLQSITSFRDFVKMKLAFALHSSCAANNIMGVRRHLENGVNSDQPDSNGNTPLLIACGKNGNLELVNLLVGSRANLKTKSITTGNTALHAAAEAGDEHIVKYLLTFWLVNEIDTQNNAGLTPLALACKSGNIEMIKSFLQYGADTKKIDRAIYEPLSNEIKTLLHYPLHEACKAGNYWGTQKQIENGVSVKAFDLQGWTPLHLAAGEGRNFDIVRILIAQQADVNAKYQAQITPFHCAAAQGNAEIVEYLLSQGVADIDAQTNQGLTPLALACQHNKTDIIVVLLSHGADPAKIKQGIIIPAEAAAVLSETPLHKACRNGSVDDVRKLLADRAKVDHPNQDGNTPLHLACEISNNTIIQMLAEKTSKIDHPNKVGLTALHIACMKGNLKGAQILIEKHANINKKTSNTYEATPLFFACNANPAIVQLLLEKSADVNYKDKNGFTALHYSAGAGKAESVKCLLNSGLVADIDARNNTQETPLTLASKRGHLEVVDILRNHGADPEKIPPEIYASLPKEIKEKAALPPLHKACREGNIESVQELLRSGAKVDLKDKDGNNALHLACLQGDCQIIQMVAEKIANIDDTNKLGFTALHIVCGKGNVRGAEIILGKKADINKAVNNEHGTSPLRFACHSSLELVKLLLGKNANIKYKDKSGSTALHHASSEGKADIVNHLIKNGLAADIDAKNNLNLTALAIACQKGHLEVIDILRCHGADPSNISSELFNGLPIPPDIQARVNDNQLHKACREGNVKAVEEWLRIGVNVDLLDKEGNSALHLACMQGDCRIIKMVADATSDINQLSGVKNVLKGNRTALQITCDKGNYEGAKILIDKRADVNKCAAQNKPPLFYACRKNLKLVELLIQKGADFKSKSHGRIPLHEAAAYSKLDIVEYFLSNKMVEDIDTFDLCERTPLYEAVFSISSDPKVVDLLLSYGADPEKIIGPSKSDEEELFEETQGKIAELKNTPLHRACANGDAKTVRDLLQKGARVDIQNKDGDLPIHMACTKNNSEIIRILADKTPNLEQTNDKGKTPFHIACEHGSVEGVKILQGKKVKTSALDELRNTPLHLACVGGNSDIIRMIAEVTSNIDQTNDEGKRN